MQGAEPASWYGAWSVVWIRSSASWDSRCVGRWNIRANAYKAKLALAKLSFDRISGSLAVLIVHLLEFSDRYYFPSNVMSDQASIIRDSVISVAVGSDHICLGISPNN